MSNSTQLHAFQTNTQPSLASVFVVDSVELQIHKVFYVDSEDSDQTGVAQVDLSRSRGTQIIVIFVMLWLI